MSRGGRPRTTVSWMGERDAWTRGGVVASSVVSSSSSSRRRRVVSRRRLDAAREAVTAWSRWAFENYVRRARGRSTLEVCVAVRASA